ncbi:hypothetical protein HYPSUDRAFT_148736, partial [Hypholoma sublateritium FD-334 SS-4]
MESKSERNDAPIIATVKGRSLPEGLGSLGTKSLRIFTKILGINREATETRLDSGADITLMSEECYNSVEGLPKIRDGMRMKLYHLTGGAKVLGYVRTVIFVNATDGTIVSFELEAYVVRGMRVPLLLGEDFQSTYEIGIVRHASGRTEVKVGNRDPRTIEASSAPGVELGFEIRQAFVSQSFVRAKAVRRAKARNSTEERGYPVVAAQDVIISKGAVHNVKVKADFGTKKEWLVEKFIIGTDTPDVLATPATWINSDHPFLPIANPSSRAWCIRAGDV